MDRRWLLGGLLVAGGIGLVKALGSRPRIGANTRLMLIGDSMAQGLSPQIKALATDAKVPWIGRGVPGTRIDQWAKSPWLDQYLAEFQPTLIIVVLGTNDAYMGGNVWARQQPHVQELIDKIQHFPNKYANDAPGLNYAAGAEVVWIGPPSLPDPYNNMHVDQNFLEELRNAVPNYFASDELDLQRGPDGLHPTVAGFAGWSGRIWSWLT